MIRILFVCLMTVLLSGCWDSFKTIVYKDRFHVVTLDEMFLKECVAARPLSVAEYTALSMDDREGALADYSNVLLAELAACNAQIKAAKTEQDRLKALYPPPTP